MLRKKSRTPIATQICVCLPRRMLYSTRHSLTSRTSKETWASSRIHPGLSAARMLSHQLVNATSAGSRRCVTFSGAMSTGEKTDLPLPASFWVVILIHELCVMLVLQGAWGQSPDRTDCVRLGWASDSSLQLPRSVCERLNHFFLSVAVALMNLRSGRCAERHYVWGNIPERTEFYVSTWWF
jgi:hypothetical protein